MALKYLLSQADLERRLLNWISKAHVPRYPFFDGVPASPDLSTASLASSTSGLASTRLSSSIGSSANTQDLNQWLEFIEDASRECDIEESQYPDTAVWFMRGELKEVMKERREVYVREARQMGESKKRSTKIGDWEDFKKDLRRVVEGATKIFLSATTQSRPNTTVMSIPAATQTSISGITFAHLRRTHPYIASSLSLGLVIGGTVVLLPAISLGIEAWNRMKEGANRAGAQVGCPA